MSVREFIISFLNVDDEYYIIKEFLDDLESDITTDDRIKLNEIILNYESKKT
jgi:hypothetical protein